MLSLRGTTFSLKWACVKPHLAYTKHARNHIWLILSMRTLSLDWVFLDQRLARTENKELELKSDKKSDFSSAIIIFFILSFFLSLSLCYAFRGTFSTIMYQKTTRFVNGLWLPCHFPNSIAFKEHYNWKWIYRRTCEIAGMVFCSSVSIVYPIHNI